MSTYGQCLDGRVALVTGASSGLGARFAAVLYAAGAGVVTTAPVPAMPGRCRISHWMSSPT